MCETEPLFDMEQTKIRHRDRVIARTIWGDEEGVVYGIQTIRGEEWVVIDLARGDRIYMSAPRVVKVDED